jgi:hypothetical protein
VSFTDNGDGTATLAGTPAAGSAGSYPITITASNGVSPNATQSFTLNVNAAPAITSGSSTTFATGHAGSFTVTSTGNPTPSLSKSGALPSGVSFTDNGDGTATLAGTPAAGSAGSYPITITASNGVSPNATQSFSLTVDAAPSVTITTPAQNASYTQGQAVNSSFTCTGGTGGQQITSCVDQDHRPSGQPVDTTSTGSHTFTVTATNQNGQTTTASVSYQVTSGGGGSGGSGSAQTTTATSIASSQNPSITGRQVTYTATVSPKPDGGTVTFADGGAPIAGCEAVPLTTNTATCTVTYGTAGSHPVRASYSGDGSYTGSQSPSLTQVVTPPSTPGRARTSTTLTSIPKSVVTGQRVTYTATVTSTPDHGTVIFRDNGKTMRGCKAVAVVHGRARCRTTYDNAGSHRIQAAYSGDAKFAGSRSSVRTERVRFSAALDGSPSVSRRGINVGLRCASRSGGCRIKLTLTTRAGHGRTIVLGTAAIVITAGGTKDITIALNPTGAELLEDYPGALPTQLTVSLRVGGRTRTLALRRMTLSTAGGQGPDVHSAALPQG